MNGVLVDSPADRNHNSNTLTCNPSKDTGGLYVFTFNSSAFDRWVYAKPLTAAILA